MGSYRIGRKFAQHVYPEAPRGGGAPNFARNFATGKTAAFEAADLTVSWNPSVGSAGVDIPITPRSTGVIAIYGFLTISNGEATSQAFDVTISVDGDAVPGSQESEVIVPASGLIPVPFSVQVTGLAVGVEVPVRVVIEGPGSDLELSLEGATITIQEEVVPTG